MGFICLQTISLVYLVTAVVGVETWYQPVLWKLLYRDLFTFMIIGEVLTRVVIYIIFFLQLCNLLSFDFQPVPSL